jgi:hypothetical protein
MLERRQVLFSSGNAETPQLIEILPEIFGRDLGESKATPFAPGEESLHGVKIGTAGMWVANLAVEKFLQRRRSPPDPHG